MKKRKELDEIINIIYIGLIGFIVAMLIMSVFRPNLIKQKNLDKTGITVTELTPTEKENDDTSCGVEDVYIYHLPNQISGEKSIMFYSIHQQVKIYCDGELVYELKRNDRNIFGKTPGCQWNYYGVSGDDAGRDITIVTDPVYDSARGETIRLYYGSEHQIFASVLKREALSLIIGMLIFVFGVGLFLYAEFLYIVKRRKDNIRFLAIFSVTIGLWKLSELQTTAFWIRGSTTLGSMPFCMLLLVALPFAMYVKNSFEKEDSILWYIPIISSILVTTITVILQLLRICDLREIIRLNHVVLALTLITVMGMSFYIGRKNGATRRLKISIGCVIAGVFGGIFDLINYNLNPGNAQTVMVLIGFFAFIFVLGIFSINDTKRLLRTGMEAKNYHHMAFYDGLTGLRNRNGFEADINREIKYHKKCILITFDLNDMKKCNDTFGHDVGDEYLKVSANIIDAIFGEKRLTYRLGGDEFWAILFDVPKETCDEYIKRMSQMEEVYNEEKKYPFEIHIACGYAIYNNSRDYDYNDTMRRADRNMYLNKFEIKAKQ